MTITVEAIYENGVLRPIEPLPLAEHDKVRVTVEPPLRVPAAGGLNLRLGRPA
jgi:predicted DNA-binding antitoxin AbrB/MazE fold protein